MPQIPRNITLQRRQRVSLHEPVNGPREERDYVQNNTVLA